MFDVDGIFGEFGVGAPLGVFGFVVLLALIGAVSSWLKARAVQETVREAIRAGTPLDAATLREIKGEGEGSFGRGTTGLILLAVAAALTMFGWMASTVGEEPSALAFFAAVSAFPGLIGVAFLVSRAFSRSEG